MLLSVVVVDEGSVGSRNSTSLFPVDSVRAYRACDSSACLPSGIVDGIMGASVAFVLYGFALWPTMRFSQAGRAIVCRWVVVFLERSMLVFWV